MLKKNRNSRLFFLIKNICCLVRCDIYKEIEEIKYKQNIQQKQLFSLNIQKTMLEVRDKILLECAENKMYNEKYQKEIEYIRDFNMAAIFPYKQLKKVSNCVVATDESCKLPYVIHKDKKLYFSKYYSEDLAKTTYINFIENENIFGGGYKEKSPHQYQSELIKIEQGDVLVDIGCAEGLFALDVIDNVKRVYLIESDMSWIAALKATFEPYKEKVTIINKIVSDSDSETTIKLESILQPESDETPIFIKMDIEGAETVVLESSRDVLKKRDNIKMSCCTYHKQNDATDLKAIFDEMNFYSEFSEGYMLFVYDKLTPPYFRKGVIRAKKNL